ncbi:9209_t:CDS:2 [Cetraspora pellucida]|uniref:9209_t:CDS:1 n=1 Tax=Cetraspora pellucida TaxID=1433469 RepID=A0ACA9M183_9GLOM|nr:9209_t:CDS:2 [Cetraspora pellucida]
MSTVDLNMFYLDNTQESQVIYNNPIEELDVPKIFQYSKEKYESQKMKNNSFQSEHNQPVYDPNFQLQLQQNNQPQPNQLDSNLQSQQYQL